MMKPADLAALAPREQWTYHLLIFDLHLAATGAADSSRRKHSGVLAQLRDAHRNQAPWALSHEDLVAWLAAEAIAPATWRSKAASARAFYAWAVKAGHLAESPAGALPTSRPKSLPAPRTGPQRKSGPPRAVVPEAWREPLAAFDVHQTVRGRPETTRATRRQELSRLARRAAPLGPWELSEADLYAYVIADQGLAPETRRTRRTTLRSFYRWAVEAGHLETSPAHRLPPVSVPQPLPRPIPDQALADALDGAEDRVRLILRLAAELGLRRAEIAQAHTRDLHEVGDRTVMLVHGKGARERTVPVPQRLARWLATFPEGYLLPSASQIGHLTPRTVGKLAAAALPTPHTLHTLRHRYATSAYRVSRDLYAVQRLLGHASPTITQRYVGLDVAGLHGLADAIAETPLPVPSRLAATG